MRFCRQNRFTKVRQEIDDSLAGFFNDGTINETMYRCIPC
jgi:hypothetical protein